MVGGGVLFSQLWPPVWAEILVWLVRWLVVDGSLADSVVPGCGAPICYHKGGKRAKGAYQKGQVLQYCALKKSSVTVRPAAVNRSQVKNAHSQLLLLTCQLFPIVFEYRIRRKKMGKRSTPPYTYSA